MKKKEEESSPRKRRVLFVTATCKFLSASRSGVQTQLRLRKRLLCIKMALLLSISLSCVGRRRLSRCSFPPRVAISSCCVLNSPRRAVPRVCVCGPSVEEKFLTSPRRWLGMHSRRLKEAGKGPASAATIVAQQRRRSRKRDGAV
jgi:hypothetical protein